MMTYQKIAGCLQANTHPGSYTSQDAYQDLFVTERIDVEVLERKGTNLHFNSPVDAAIYGRQGSVNGCYRGGEEVKHYAVRRLTPMEAERLQGFPDGWTDIGDWVDSKGRTHKGESDSNRYKALGNSLCLPFWKWLAKRISAQYERDITLGSLFDGIGGFPLVFEQINGEGSCRWCSEIDEFCIAVTKKRFLDEVDGDEQGQ